MQIDLPDLDDVQIEDVCYCRGPLINRWSGEYEREPNRNCNTCKGTGYRLTSVGQRVYDMLVRRGFIKEG